MKQAENKKFNEIIQTIKNTHIKKKQQIKEAKSNSKKGTAAFPCPKCKKSNSKITERQMRSGDEPPTIFVTCLECNHTHKLS